MKKLMFLVIALVFVASCSKGGGQKGDYVIKIDSTVISKEDMQQEMNSLPDMAKEFFLGPEGTTRFADELVKKEMLYLEAKKRGLDKNKDLLKKIDEYKKITLINSLLEKEIEAAAKVTDKEIQDYYNTNKNDFTMNSQIRISHIVVKTEDEAKKAYERLQKGEDFAKIASSLSVDKATAKIGGDLGSFKRGEMSRELEEVAFRLKKGEVSQPVKLKDGIHILKATETKGTTVEFDKIKGQIGQKLTADKQKDTFDKFIEKLKKTYKVDINKDALSKLNAAPAQPAPQVPAQK